MPIGDRNKLNRVEELKSKLFSKDYRTKIEHRDNFSHLTKREVVDSWKTHKRAESNPEENFFMKSSMFGRFFIFSAVFFLLTSIYASYIFFAGGNTVSNDNIDITVLGNNFTAGGEELPLIIGVANRNNSPLDLVDLVLEYPKGSKGDLALETERLRVSLGTIPSGAVRNENLKVILFGEQGSTRPIKITLEYRVAGSNAIFVKEKLYNVTINSTPINLTVEAPSLISPNQDFTMDVRATLNSTRVTQKILVKAEYPAGFVFINSVPSPSFGNNVWDLGDLAPGAEHSISISGKMLDVFDGEEKTVNISSGSQAGSDKSSIGVVFNSVSHLFSIKKAFIEANILVNGASGREYATDSKTPVSVEIRYANNLDIKVNDLRIEAKLSGNAFDRKTIRTTQGFYDSATDTIIWDKNYKNQLKEVNPGDSDSVTFSVSPLPLFGTSGDVIANPVINIGVDIEGSQVLESSSVNELNNSSSAIVRIISDVGFAPKALYYSGSFKNKGPIPPKVEEATTYTVVWTLTNTANSISKTQVRATLPPWTTFVGPFLPATEDLTYNETTREVLWLADRIPRGAGITVARKEVSFQVSFSPSLSQLGTTPVIVNGAVLTGHDDFANVDVRVTKAGLNTNLVADPSFPKNGAAVVE